jgi:hypothetical protein
MSEKVAIGKYVRWNANGSAKWGTVVTIFSDSDNNQPHRQAVIRKPKNGYVVVAVKLLSVVEN